MEEPKYKWRLTWCGRKPSPKLLFAASHCQTFPLWRDAEAHLVNHQQYTALVEAGEISPPVSYWRVEPGQLGMISLSHYSQYRTTWDAISLAKTDFEDGWLACEQRILAQIKEAGPTGLAKILV